MTTILLVEDDEDLGNTLTERLKKESYSVLLATSCAEAHTHLAKNRVDIAILDIGLPDGNGFSLARELQESTAYQLPLVFLTAMNSAEFRLEGYELGAEDFIPKPFHLQEFILRLKKVLHRHSLNQLVNCGAFHLNPESLAISFHDGRQTFLQRKDFDLLHHLVTSSPRIISREDIMKEVWKSGPNANTRTIDNAIVRLRNQLGEKYRDNLQSIRGVGYQWRDS